MLTQAEFKSENGGTFGWLSGGRFALGEVKDARTGETFSQCLKNMAEVVLYYCPERSLQERQISVFNHSGETTVGGLSKLNGDFHSFPVYERPVTSTPGLTEGQLSDFCSLLEEHQHVEPKDVRSLAIKLYWSSPDKVVQLCKDIEHTTTLGAKELGQLTEIMSGWSSLDSRMPPAPLTVSSSAPTDQAFPVKEATWKGDTYKTLSTPLLLDFPARKPFNNPAMTKDQWTELEYETETDPKKVDQTLKDNLDRARSQGERSKGLDAGAFTTALESQKGFGTPSEFSNFESGHFADNRNVAFASTWGNSPTPYMEDAAASGQIICKLGGVPVPVNFTAVLDGHAMNDDSLAQRCANRLAEQLALRLEELNSKNLTRTGIVAALNAAVVDLERKEHFPFLGTTLNMTVTIGDHLFCANVGDSRAILLKPDGSFAQLSEDASPLSEDARFPEEAELASTSPFNRSIHDRGGAVVTITDDKLPEYHRVKVHGPNEKPRNALPMTHSIGDMCHQGALSARPTITAIPLSDIPKGSTVLQMSDGVTETFSTEQIAKIAHSSDQKNASAMAEKVRDSAYFLHDKRKGSTDNIMVTAYSIA